MRVDVRHIAGVGRVHTRDGCVGAGEQPLRGSFLVAGGAVDLAGQVQAANAPALQAGQQLARVDVVVLHRVCRLQHPRTLQAWRACTQGI